MCTVCAARGEVVPADVRRNGVIAETGGVANPSFGVTETAMRVFKDLSPEDVQNHLQPCRLRGCYGLGLAMSVFIFLVIAGSSSTCWAALPKRLVLLVDGVSYGDMVALQEGITSRNWFGKRIIRRGFNEGYFPASRMVSTFPSASDVAWTEMLGNRPLPGYQRTYFDVTSGAVVRQNGVTTTMEYEMQMHWELSSGFRRAFGYLHPRATFKHETRELVKAFLQTRDGTENFYGMIRASDDAQHTMGDIIKLLCLLDDELKKLSERYHASEGRQLEILILSDHGNDHAGARKRVPIGAFLKKSGYRVADRMGSAKDIVLPTVGIESWVEVHCAPQETERLAALLPDLKGLDCLTARVMQRTNQFVVLNAKHERARIDWKPEQDSFRYFPERGDPLGYQPVLDALARKRQLDSDGFASADAWMHETITHRYPLALERIARGHTQVTVNPASILISLSHGYVHSSWVLKRFSSLVRQGGTHGSLDDLASNGVVLGNFAPTMDTSTRRVAALYEGFQGLRTVVTIDAKPHVAITSGSMPSPGAGEETRHHLD